MLGLRKLIGLFCPSITDIFLDPPMDTVYLLPDRPRKAEVFEFLPSLYSFCSERRLRSSFLRNKGGKAQFRGTPASSQRAVPVEPFIQTPTRAYSQPVDRYSRAYPGSGPSTTLGNRETLNLLRIGRPPPYCMRFALVGTEG